MGKKSRNKRNQSEKLKIDSNPGCRWSIAILDVPKKLDFELPRNEDIISSMHDDILSHVISFLPFKSAVQTSFLSTRWKDVWKRNFPERKGTIDEAFSAISSFLHGRCDRYSEQKPTSNWGFIFNLGKRSFITVAAEPDTALQLDFSNVKHELPWRFDWFLDIDGPSYNTLFFNKPSSFSITVKSLHLKSVSCTFSGAVSSMMTDFKFLESLTIENFHGLRSLTLDAAGNSRLKKLTILDCQQLESLNLDAYSLQSLRFRGKLLSFQRGYGSTDWFWPWPADFDLVDAMFDFRQGPHCSNLGSCGFRSFFRSYKDVKSLTLCGWIFEPLIYPTLQLHPFGWGFEFKRLVELWWIDYAKNKFNSDALISFLKHCPRLTRLYITIDPKSYRRTNTMTDYSVEVASVPRLKDLKVVKLEGFPNEKEEIILAKRLKQEFQVEPLIIAKSNYLNCARLVVKTPDIHELLKEGEGSYKFIEVRVEHLYDLCPKHLHMYI
ncbi:F-box protein At2g39490-like [Hibiscus syriacus]|uniref:F-box protein At2g39490-like n=1 Tax=Hibiscus syriacus TaxID=106335 RepID=UPI00192163E6|nr:F-box protein At2g39490-like [Hibiscus syriacus]